MTLESPADWVADGLPPKIPEWEEIGNTARAFGQRVVLAKIALVKTRVVFIFFSIYSKLNTYQYETNTLVFVYVHI